LITPSFGREVKPLVPAHVLMSQICRVQVESSPWRRWLGSYEARNRPTENKRGKKNSDNHWNRYTVARNKYSQSIKKTRCEYVQRKIDQHQNNSKELWKILKSLLKPSNCKPRSITFDGTLEQSEQVISSKFN